MTQLTVGKYLFTSGYYERVDEIEILKVSRTSYYLKWESGSRSWRTKKDFHSEYELLEKL